MLYFIQSGPVQIMYGTFTGRADLCSLVMTYLLSWMLSLFAVFSSFAKTCLATIQVLNTFSADIDLADLLNLVPLI